jgi:K+-sensing histidine kinase KdpD
MGELKNIGIAMPQEKDFIGILRIDYHNFEKAGKSLLKTFSKMQEFFNHLNQYLPIEFFFILLGSLIITFLLNSVSKKTKFYHLLVGVLMTVVSSMILSRFLLHKYRDWGFISSGLIILVPVYLFAGIVYLISYAKKQYIKNKLASPSSISQSLFNLHNSYNEAVQLIHLYQTGKDLSIEDVREKLLALRLSTDGMLMTFELQNREHSKQETMIEDKEDDLDFTEKELIPTQTNSPQSKEKLSPINLDKS